MSELAWLRLQEVWTWIAQLIWAWIAVDSISELRKRLHSFMRHAICVWRTRRRQRNHRQARTYTWLQTKVCVKAVMLLVFWTPFAAFFGYSGLRAQQGCLKDRDRIKREYAQVQQIERQSLAYKRHRKQTEAWFQQHVGYVVYAQVGRTVTYMGYDGRLRDVTLDYPAGMETKIIRSNDAKDYRHPPEDYQMIRGFDLKRGSIIAYHFVL